MSKEMWLSSVLFGSRWTPGRQWIGKHRRVVKMTYTRRRNAKKRELMQKEVIEQLSRPYLTQSEETRHARERKSQYVPKWKLAQEQRWMKKQKLAFSELQSVAKSTVVPQR